MFDIYYSVSSRFTSEHAGGFSPNATWPNPHSHQISSGRRARRRRRRGTRAVTRSIVPPALLSSPPSAIATWRPRARVVAPRPAQLSRSASQHRWRAHGLGASISALPPSSALSAPAIAFRGQQAARDGAAGHAAEAHATCLAPRPRSPALTATTTWTSAPCKKIA